MIKKILLIGGSGSLGSNIKSSKLFKNILSPSKRKLSLLNKKLIRKYLNQGFDCVINCAALARMRICEKNPNLAKKINIDGVLNLVNELKLYNKKHNKNVKLIHISTDGVYASTKGNYSEQSNLRPYNVYGWTKFFSEKIVKKYSNYVIIRTRFFDKKKIKFDTAATDIYTSMMEVRELVKEIFFISTSPFKGIINIGSRKKSDYQNYVKYKKKIKRCKRKDIIKDLDFTIAKDASLNISKFKKLKKIWKKNYQ